MGDVRSGCCTYSLTTTISGNLIFLLVVFYFTSTCVCFIYCTINVHIKATTELSFILITQRYIYLNYINKKNPPKFRRILFLLQDLESYASASVVSSAAGASSVAASAFSAASAAAASALLLANSAIRASLTLASASNLSF